MGYEYFEVTAEVGIRAWGATIEASFVEAARALFALMVDISQVRAQRSITLDITAETCELLLADWLNQLILARDRDGLVFSAFIVTITHQESSWCLKAEARGERLDRARHDPRIEVKAATYHGLSIRNVESRGVEVECVLDI